jgi:hypothetical protein
MIPAGGRPACRGSSDYRCRRAISLSRGCLRPSRWACRPSQGWRLALRPPMSSGPRGVVVRPKRRREARGPVGLRLVLIPADDPPAEPARGTRGGRSTRIYSLPHHNGRPSVRRTWISDNAAGRFFPDPGSRGARFRPVYIPGQTPVPCSRDSLSALTVVIQSMERAGPSSARSLTNARDTISPGRSTRQMDSDRAPRPHATLPRCPRPDSPTPDPTRPAPADVPESFPAPKVC